MSEEYLLYIWSLDVPEVKHGTNSLQLAIEWALNAEME